MTPEDVMGMAVQYLNIYFYGLPFLFMYNVRSSMFNALGKSRIPLYFLIFSSVFNVALDLVLVIQFDLGVAGVAWATMIAQGISAVMSFFVLIRELKKFSCGQAETFNGGELKDMTKIALPSILQQSTVSIGMMLVQSVVNSFGSEALAGFSAAMRIESICVVPMSGIRKRGVFLHGAEYRRAPDETGSGGISCSHPHGDRMRSGDLRCSGTVSWRDHFPFSRRGGNGHGHCHRGKLPDLYGMVLLSDRV